MNLDSISSTRTQYPPRILIYGTAGLGKTTFGSQMPAPVFIPSEDGLSDIEVPAFPQPESFADVLGCVNTLIQDQHEYRTVVIDTIDALERLIWAQVAQEQNVTSLEDIGYGKGYMLAVQHWENLLAGLNHLRINKGMAVLLLAHSKIVKFQNPLGNSYDRYEIDLHKSASSLIQEQCDIVGFCNYRVHTIQEDQGFKKVAKAIGDGVRELHLEERPGWLSKNRYNMPPTIPFDVAEFLGHVKTAASAAPKLKTTGEKS